MVFLHISVTFCHVRFILVFLNDTVVDGIFNNVCDFVTHAFLVVVPFEIHFFFVLIFHKKPVHTSLSLTNLQKLKQKAVHTLHGTTKLKQTIGYCPQLVTNSIILLLYSLLFN